MTTLYIIRHPTKGFAVHDTEDPTVWSHIEPDGYEQLVCFTSRAAAQAWLDTERSVDKDAHQATIVTLVEQPNG